MEYREEDFLQLSGIQHFDFCRRQWALIHIEQQWEENLKTVEGNISHERCHNERFEEKRGDLLITRGLRIFSRTLGVSGQCDVVEFTQAEDGCRLSFRTGLWQPYPVEYKHGRTKAIDADRLQLCGQAMCLEEMLATSIPRGAIYYVSTKSREEVLFTDELREKVKGMLAEMHQYFARGYTPKPKEQKGCKACSMLELCLPVLGKKQDVNSYYKRFLEGEAE